MDPSTECMECPAGHITDSEEESGPCIRCDNGKHAGTGAYQCNDCLAGYADEDLDPGTECTQCPEGRADLDGSAVTECEICARGKYTASGTDPDGSPSFALHAATLCLDCPSGTSDHDELPSSACRDCANGKYSALLSDSGPYGEDESST
eukprot:SAG31_NODE_14535_length_801_cov_0.679487_1_plen_149_part_01